MATTPLDVTDNIEKKKKALEDEIEKKQLLEEIRKNFIRDQDTPIKVTDILPEGVEKLSVEELRNVVRNIQIHRNHNSSILNVEGIILGLDKLIAYFSNDEISVKSATGDEDLKTDINELLSQYIGEIPLITRIVVRLLSHAEYGGGTREETKT